MLHPAAEEENVFLFLLGSPNVDSMSENWLQETEKMGRGLTEPSWGGTQVGGRQTVVPAAAATIDAPRQDDTCRRDGDVW